MLVLTCFQELLIYYKFPFFSLYPLFANVHYCEQNRYFLLIILHIIQLNKRTIAANENMFAVQIFTERGCFIPAVEYPMENVGRVLVSVSHYYFHQMS